jgi:hypothetical protein
MLMRLSVCHNVMLNDLQQIFHNVYIMDCTRFDRFQVCVAHVKRPPFLVLSDGIMVVYIVVSCRSYLNLHALVLSSRQLA